MVEIMQAQIEEKVRASIDVADLVIQDTTCGNGCGTAFRLVVISEDFVDVKLLDRQRQVNEILQTEIPQLHALELKTWTPE